MPLHSVLIIALLNIIAICLYLRFTGHMSRRVGLVICALFLAAFTVLDLTSSHSASAAAMDGSIALLLAWRALRPVRAR